MIYPRSIRHNASIFSLFSQLNTLMWFIEWLYYHWFTFGSLRISSTQLKKFPSKKHLHSLREVNIALMVRFFSEKIYRGSLDLSNGQLSLDNPISRVCNHIISVGLMTHDTNSHPGLHRWRNSYKHWDRKELECLINSTQCFKVYY